MFQVPSGVSSPAFLKDSSGIRVVDITEAVALCKKRLADKSGTLDREVTNGSRNWRANLPYFVMKRASGNLTSMSGESAHMNPHRPTAGAVWESGYARRLVGFAAGHPEAQRLFRAWRGRRISAHVDEELTHATAGRAILFMPTDGKKPRAGVDVEEDAVPKPRIRRTENGMFEIDGVDGGWELIASSDAEELLASRCAVMASR